MLRSIFQLLTHSFNTLFWVACDLFGLLVLLSPSRRALAAENLFLRKQLALVPGAQGETTPGPSFDPTDHAHSGPHVLLAWRFGDRPAGYLHPLAPQGIPSLLALEIPAFGQTANPQGSPPTYLGDGSRESDLGRGTHRQ